MNPNAAWSSAVLGRVRDVPPRIGVLSSIRLFRDGLLALLKNVTTADIVAMQPMNIDGMSQLSTVEPNVILVQVGGRADALFVRSALQRIPQAQLIAVGVPDNDDVIVACAQAGVAGYVSAEATIEDLMATIDAVINGRPAATPRIAAALLRHIASARDGSDGLVSSMTGREREILHCLREGMSNKEIAYRLHIETSTVKNHIHNILQKLHVHRRAEAAAVMRKS